MPEVLHLKPEEIDTVDKRAKYTVSVVGCGQSGVLYGALFAEAGFKVICTDADQSLVKRLARGKTEFPEREITCKIRSLTKTGAFTATSDLKGAVKQSDVIILAIEAKIDAKTSDFSEVENNCKQVGAALKRGSLVIYGAVAGFGFMETVVKENLENSSGLKIGEDFGLAYSPIRVFDEYPSTYIVSVVAADDDASLTSASAFLAAVCKKDIHRVTQFKKAELAVLFEAARRDTNIALNNELAILCENAGTDYFEVMKLLDKDALFSDSAPTTAGGRRSESYFLMEMAENLNAKLKLTALSRQTNEDIVRHAVNLTQDALRSCGRTFRRAKIVVLGATGPGTSGETFARMLGAKGAKTSVYDPQGSKSESANSKDLPKRSLNDVVEGSDCIVQLSGRELKPLNIRNLRPVMRLPAAIVDLTGTLEPQEVETEGFIYRGLGRGTGKK
jgi:nucleotide sugar dehydrogenase